MPSEEMQDYLTSEIAAAKELCVEHLATALAEASKEEPEVGVIEGAVCDALAMMNRRVALLEVLSVDDGPVCSVGEGT